MDYQIIDFAPWNFINTNGYVVAGMRMNVFLKFIILMKIGITITFLIFVYYVLLAIVKLLLDIIG